MVLLYHGTTATAGRIIKAKGLRPARYLNLRNEERDWATNANPDAVYLGTIQAPYFSYKAATMANEADYCLIEIDTSRLISSLFMPDEDFIVGYCQQFTSKDLRSRANSGDPEFSAFLYRKVIEYAYLWPISLANGCCAYHGSISREHITRVLTVNRKEFDARGHKVYSKNSGYQKAAFEGMRSGGEGIDWGTLWLESTKRFVLDEWPHGPLHWINVESVGLKLAEANGADSDVVRLFAALHDVCRRDDHQDPRHGPRAAKLAREWRGRLFELDDEQFEKLFLAIEGHTDGRISNDPTIGACWDADRLDLPRVGIQPDVELLSTNAARAYLKQCGMVG